MNPYECCEVRERVRHNCRFYRDNLSDWRLNLSLIVTSQTNGKSYVQNIILCVFVAANQHGFYHNKSVKLCYN